MSNQKTQASLNVKHPIKTQYAPEITTENTSLSTSFTINTNQGKQTKGKLKHTQNPNKPQTHHKKKTSQTHNKPKPTIM